ncbi:MAG: hypothetical protein WC087_02310 [Candidatus Paceibacterota bacterium]
MIKNILSTIFIFTLLIGCIPFFEPSILNAIEDEVLVNLTVDSGISITSPADVTMSNLGTSVNTSTGGAVWNVKTNDPDGYSLSVKASAAPAMVSGGNSFLDYTEATPGTPDAWSVDASTIQFGFSGLGTDVVNVNSDQYAATGQTTCDNGVASSTVNSTLRFLGFETSNQTLATRAATTTTAGIDTRICFAAAQNGVYAPAGAYQATITATAVAL